jgi:hypothetical protein
MKSLKWVFCALAISAGAYYSIGSSNAIVGDNIEALTSGDANVTFEEHESFPYLGDTEQGGWYRLPSGYCLYCEYGLCSAENNSTCIEIVVRP